MSDDKDLMDQARSTQEDFYDLLGIEFECSEADIKRAYRKTSLKYHPDKHPGNTAIVEKFHLLAIARDVLLEPAAKSAYDAARLRRKERALQNLQMDSKRRAMISDLEKREGALKRKRDAGLTPEELEAQNIMRLAEDGKRRRKEREERLRRERQEEDKTAEVEADKQASAEERPKNHVAELDRTIKVRWVREGSGVAVDKEKLSEMFSRFGAIESAGIMKDRKSRLEGEKHRKVVATGFIVFTSIVSAHAAVEDAKQTYDFLDRVFWANKEPEITSPMNGNFSAPSTPASTPKSFRASFPGVQQASGSKGTPTFNFSPQSPSLEEVTLMRLKQRAAEKRRLEEQIQNEEAAEG